MTADSFNIEKISSEEKDRESDQATYKINTFGTDFTLEVLSKKIDDKEIIIPPFQRRFVWPHKKASKLIESFLLGLPVPQIFLYRDEKSQDLLVVDGQQRLKTINYFFNEKFEDNKLFYLQGVHQTWEGKSYSTLSESDKRKLKNTPLRATIFEQIDPKDNSSMFQIFERLNTGGMPLSQQEIRTSLYHGKIVEFLRDLNKNSIWRKLIGKEAPDARMRDVELILRFFSLYKNWQDYKPSMKDFMNDFMKKNKNLNIQVQKEWSSLFNNTIDTIYNKIGKNAFRLKKHVNVAVFDSIMITVAELKSRLSNDLKNKFEKLIKETAYINAVSQATTNPEQIQTRIKITKQLFKK